MLANRSFCFHPGGVIASLGLLSSIPDINKSKSMIIDYGCGNGLTLTALAKLGFTNLVGFDVNKEMIRQNQIADICNIKFFSNYNEMIEKTQTAEILLMESVFTYIDEESEDSFINGINNLIKSLNIQYTAIIDLYQFSAKNEKLFEIISSIFGIKNLRNKASLLYVLSKIKAKNNLKIQKEHLYHADKNFAFNINEMVLNLVNIYPESKLDKDGLKTYFLNYSNDMNKAFQLFKNNFRYITCLIEN